MEKLKKSVNVVIILIVALSIASGLWCYVNNRTQENCTVKVEFELADGTNLSTYEIDTDEVYLDKVIVKLVDSQDFSYDSYGMFLKSYEGFKNGDDNYYWIVYENDEMAMDGISKLRIDDLDVFTFRFEKFE